MLNALPIFYIKSPERSGLFSNPSTRNLLFQKNKCIINTEVLRTRNCIRNILKVIMIPRFKKTQKTTSQFLNKEQFLEEHNKLSPENLKATISLLSRFKEEKASLFKNNNWPIDKLRRPFIVWLTALPFGKKKTQVKIDKLSK